ncbi:zf-HC2 domain-containing protein [Streptomyces sp. HNM0574]|uniref:zf-HC2 domain-containing protein n=1 Tax=Streptomyces sp. HNM0574 TaxID=2714954 RepID=UPI00146B2E0A|nr:zf-HC2 domain-containing protein [Streptomyces sp. HNM0574]NLU68618.1 zf-HC2 domain-containing protein [Streptomyces sp. HNM0574]
MLCSRARTAISAELDGEALPPGVSAGRLRTHLAECASCRAWQARAAALDRELTGGNAPAEPAERAG